MQKLWWIANLGIWVMLLGLVWMYIESRSGWATQRQPGRQKRSLKARSPKDCEQCWVGHVLGEAYGRSGPLPWSAVKSRRGRPKQYDSQGLACMNKACPYYTITDAQVHALRRDGQRNVGEPAAQWECGCCLSKHTAWLGTPQYRLKTPSQEVCRALHLSMKGMALGDISEVLGYAEPTVQRWLDRGGEHSQRLHRQRFKSLWLRHLQLDELVTKVRHRVKRVWIWTSIDLQTRLLVAWVTGGRTQADAHHLVHEVEARLAPGCVPTFTSDGLRHYFYALTAHFGSWAVVEGKRHPVWVVTPALLYGQLRKLRAGYRLKGIYTRLLCGTREAMRTALQADGFSGMIQTAYVERLNLTLRHLVAPLRRRTWALADNLHTLSLRLALSAAYYNFCRPHQSLQRTGRWAQTPAMAAGITDHRWSVREFLLHPLY